MRSTDSRKAIFVFLIGQGVVAEDTTPLVTNCTYKALLPPRTSAVIWGALFAEPPIEWKITLVAGAESEGRSPVL